MVVTKRSLKNVIDVQKKCHNKYIRDSLKNIVIMTQLVKHAPPKQLVKAILCETPKSSVNIS
jgi:hypothetical protein